MRIKVSFEQLSTAQTQITSISGEIQEKLGDLKRMLGNLDWEGEDREAYNEHQADWDSAMEEINELLGDIGRAVGTAGSNYQETQAASKNVWQ